MRNPNGSAVPAVWTHPELDGRVSALTRAKAAVITGLNPEGFKRVKRECPSCGGICKKSGCERENVRPKWKSISEQDMDEIIEQRHFAKGYQLHRSDITCIEWFKMGARWAESKLYELNK